ncbi:MAG: DUF2804 domain-containing protein [Sandaracinaceae bacterium]|nr:DUF2804 domain-containing protein [Sandaracinaceae bacterium]
MTAASVRPGSPIEAPAPPSLVDPRSERPRFGTYRGALGSFDLSSLRGARELFREKRWIYVILTKAPWTMALAVVDLGYAQTTFGFAAHQERGLVADLRSVPGMPGVSRVRQDGVHRLDARLVGPRTSVRVRERRGEAVLEVRASTPSLELRASLDLASAAPAMTAIAPIRGGVVDATEKRSLAPVRGAALVAGERVDLDGGLGGFDVTVGLLARETQWNWAFLQGAATTGEPIALNLVQGFVGAPECALFGRDSVHALSEGRFELPAGPGSPRDRAKRLEPWQIRTAEGEVDLRFEPFAVHDEGLDLGLVRSRFVQPIGTFSGTIRRGETLLRLERVPGVVEDQDVRW